MAVHRDRPHGKILFAHPLRPPPIRERIGKLGSPLGRDQPGRPGGLTCARWTKSAYVSSRCSAARNLRRSPGFATLVVLIMALGIGANTAVFSVVNAVLLKPLSYQDPDRIVTLSDSWRTGEAPTDLSKQVSILNFQDWHDQSSSFEAMAYYASRETAVMPGATAEYARVTSVSPEFFRVFAIEPIAGRFFTAEEMKPGSGGAVMISYAYWQRRERT